MNKPTQLETALRKKTKAELIQHVLEMKDVKDAEIRKLEERLAPYDFSPNFRHRYTDNNDGYVDRITELEWQIEHKQDEIRHLTNRVEGLKDNLTAYYAAGVINHGAYSYLVGQVVPE